MFGRLWERAGEEPQERRLKGIGPQDACSTTWTPDGEGDSKRTKASSNVAAASRMNTPRPRPVDSEAPVMHTGPTPRPMKKRELERWPPRPAPFAPGETAHGSKINRDDEDGRARDDQPAEHDHWPRRVFRSGGLSDSTSWPICSRPGTAPRLVHRT